MRSSSWVALLQHIPPDKQDGLMLVTKSGQEININNILRVDQEFVAFRGRLSASQDAGRLFFVPFYNIDYFGYQKPIKDTDFQDTFGSFALPDSATTPAHGEPAAPSSGSRGAPAIKSSVLERFRSRSNTMVGTALGTPLAPSASSPRPNGDG